MRSYRKPAVLPLTFFVWFAAWAVTSSYVSVGYYRFELGEAAEMAFRLLTLCVAVALVLVPFVQSSEAQKPRWRYAALCLVTLLVAELLWRLVMNDVPWDFVKGLGILLDVATPALFALGVAAVVAEWRARHHVVEDSATP